MSDKFRTAFPISVDFVDGELPSASKMNGLSRQAKQGLGLVEFALGDPWNQGGDSLLSPSATPSDNALTIPNLARYLGQTRHTSPRIPYLENIDKYSYKFTDDAGNYSATLTFPVHTDMDTDPGSGTAWTWTGTAPLPVGSPKATAGAVTATGEWYVDFETGQCTFFDPILASWKVVYKPIVDGDVGTEATYNIIPDMDTHSSYGFQSVKIQYVNGSDNSQGYYIFLPPRGPLDDRLPVKYPQDGYHDGNSDNRVAVAGDLYFWWDGTAAAPDGVISGLVADAEHYRYLLPKIITDSTAFDYGAVLPRGMMYLWDPVNTGTIIDGVTFTADNQTPPRKFVAIASGANLDTWLSSFGNSGALYDDTNLKSTTHEAARYPLNGLRLITIGTDLSRIVSELMSQFLNHDHSSANSMPTRPVLHTKLSETFHPTAGILSHLTTDPQFDPSLLSNDDHPQYLHRGGMNVGRDKYKNALHGDLFLASRASTNDFDGVSSDSHRLRLGRSDEFSLFYKNSTNRISLEFDGTSIAGVEFHRLSSNAQFDIGLSTSTTTVTLQSIVGALDLQSATNKDINIDTSGAGAININSDYAITLTGGFNVGLTSTFGDVEIGANGYVDIDAGINALIRADQEVDITATNGAVHISASDGNINLTANGTTHGWIDLISANDSIDLVAGKHVGVRAAQNITLTAGVTGTGHLTVAAEDYIDLNCSAGDITLSAAAGDLARDEVTIDVLYALPAVTNDAFAYASPWVSSSEYYYPENAAISSSGWFHITGLPDGCTINSITLDVDSNAASKLIATAYKNTFGLSQTIISGPTSNTATVRNPLVLTVSPASIYRVFTRSIHMLSLHIRSLASGSPDIKVYPSIKINLTHTSLDHYSR